MVRLFLPVLLLVSLAAPAQDAAEYSVFPAGRKDTIRSKYIRAYPDNFFVWPVLKQRRLDFEMQALGNRKNSLAYKSNKPYSFGVGMYLFELAFELAFAVPVDEMSERIYGNSDAKDIQMNILGKKWGADIFHQRYSGFYVVDALNPVPAASPFPQRPDIRTRNTGLSINYTHNSDRFSFRSAYNFVERQLVSAGSFIAFASLLDFSVKGDSAIIGSSFRQRFGDESSIYAVNSTITGLAPGYTYSLIYKGFFLNGALAAGPSYNLLRYSEEGRGRVKDNHFRAYVAARLSLGYNGDRFFGGLTFMNQGLNAKFQNVELTSSNSSFKILAGYRFREWGVLKKRVWDIPSALF